MAELAQFLGQILRDPAGVGAIAPSGPALAREMAARIPGHDRMVVEIGPGSGAISRAILESGLPAAKLALLELNGAFCEGLRRDFPGVAVHNRAAQDMPALGLSGLGAVVSSLPLLNMAPETRRAIADAVFDALAPGAPFIQFTYGARPPLPAETCRALGLRWQRSRRIWLNLPPATVYVFQRGAGQRGN